MQGKAQRLFKDLKPACAAPEGDCDEEFAVNRDWFNSFKERANLHNRVNLHKIKVEAASANFFVKTNIEVICQTNFFYTRKHPCVCRCVMYKIYYS